MATTKFPPGPESYIFGFDTISQIKRDPLSFYDALHRKYGDVAYMRLGPFHDYTYFHPDHIHELLTSKAKSFVRMKRQMEVFRQWNGNSVLMTEGTEWLRQRRVLQPAFGAKRFGNYGKQITDTASEYFDRHIGSGAVTIDVERMTNELTTGVICRTMFGTDLGPQLDNVRHAVSTLTKVAYKEMMEPFSLPMWLPLPSIRRKKEAIATLDTMVRGFIRERRQQTTDRGDLLSMMLLAADVETDGKGLTDEEVRDNCVTIFLAGHDTTAAGIAWLIWFLASRPHFTDRAREEVRQVIGNRTPEFADVEKLTFLDQMVSETLRHRSPTIAVFGREAIEPVELGGYTLPVGAYVHVMSYTVQHDERWFERPNEFDPERFSPERVGQIRPYAYFPFGIGPRTCIGNQFSKMEMMLIAAMLLQRYELAPAAGQNEPEPLSDVTLRPKGGVRIDVRPISRRVSAESLTT